MHPRAVHKGNQPVLDRRRDVDTHEYLKQQLLFQNGGGGNFIADGVQPYDQFSRYSGNPPLERFNGGGRTNERPRADESATPSGFLAKNKDRLEVSKLQRDNTYIRDRYLVFDSIRKKSTIEDFAKGRMTFSVLEMLEGDSLTDVIEMEIEPFTIPKPDLIVNFPNVLYDGRLFLTIEPLTAQSVKNAGTINRHHFEFTLTDVGDRYELTPIESKFIFTIPVKEIEEITFVFKGTNDIPLPLKADVIEFGPNRFENIVGVPLATVVDGVPHELTLGVYQPVKIIDIIYNPNGIPNNSPSLWAYIVDILKINSGHTIKPLDATRIEFRPTAVINLTFTQLPVFLQGPPFSVPAFTIVMAIIDRRVMPTIRFRSITREVTNMIVPV